MKNYPLNGTDYQAYINKLIIFEYVLLIDWEYKLIFTDSFEIIYIEQKHLKTKNYDKNNN